MASKREEKRNAKRPSKTEEAAAAAEAANLKKQRDQLEFFAQL